MKSGKKSRSRQMRSRREANSNADDRESLIEDMRRDIEGLQRLQSFQSQLLNEMRRTLDQVTKPL